MKKQFRLLTIALGLSILFYSCNTIESSNKQEEQKTTTAEGEGIKFFEGSWQEAKDLAKKENKLIFLDIYASWCGPCKMLKRNTFPDAAVGKFFNEHFINVTKDGEVGEGIGLAQEYRIEGYPTLLFVDANGKVINGTAGYMPPATILQFANTVVTPATK